MTLSLFLSIFSLMDSTFKQSQNALNVIQRKVKERLQEIQRLDKRCLQLEVLLEQMRQSYLEDLTKQELSLSQTDNDASSQLQAIAKLEEELNETSIKKVRIAQEIENIVAQTCQQVDHKIYETTENLTGRSDVRDQIKSLHLFQCGLRKQKGRQKNVHPQIKAIIKEYYNEKQSELTNLEKIEKYCICPPQSALSFPGNMIECQNGQCRIGWYHLECVGINFQCIPIHWFCSKCTSIAKKDVNKVTFKLNKQKFELKIEKEPDIVPNQLQKRTQVKRKRGRPRKIPLIHNELGSQ